MTSLVSSTSGLATVRAEIAHACEQHRRDVSSVTLVVVSKTFDVAAIEPVIIEGQRVFGENRVQESLAKWPALKERYPDISLHLIGPLQSNKTKEAVALFDAIHAVDRPSLCAALAKEIQKQGSSPTLFVEINTGAEPQKAGVLPEDADEFLRACRDTYGLNVKGLMCIPPHEEAPGAALCADGKNRGAQRAETSVDGDERGLSDRDPVWRDPCAGRQRDFWQPDLGP